MVLFLSGTSEDVTVFLKKKTLMLTQLAGEYPRRMFII